MLAGIKVNDIRRFTVHGREFDLRKISATEYSLGQSGLTRRRYGNRDEILQDIEAIHETGSLPKCASSIH